MVCAALFESRLLRKSQKVFLVSVEIVVLFLGYPERLCTTERIADFRLARNCIRVRTWQITQLCNFSLINLTAIYLFASYNHKITTDNAKTIAEVTRNLY